MRVVKVVSSQQRGPFVELHGDDGTPVVAVSGFLRHLGARGYSPNTLAAYAYDLLHFWRFLALERLTYAEFRPPHALELLAYLRQVPTRQPAQRLGLGLCTVDAREAAGRDGGPPREHWSGAPGGPSARRLAPATVNRVLAAVSSFYEYLILSAQWGAAGNPMQKAFDSQHARVSERHRPFMGPASRQQPIRRTVRAKTVERLPRPLDDEQIALLLASLRRRRDQAMVLLMLRGGLRPGEVLNLHLDDVQYGRRRVVVRHRTDHPKGARTKSRVERVVDLHEADALAAVSAYVAQERPRDTGSRYVFLVGGRGQRRTEPLGYAALVRLFARCCARAGIREPWVTPHALRHTHATKMWEGGMRELTLQKRLGHASPESTRVYTRVSDPVVVAEYRAALGDAGAAGDGSRGGHDRSARDGGRSGAPAGDAAGGVA
jgi:integrase